jgi:hypothetical protein
MFNWLRKLLHRNHDSFQKADTENHGETEKRIRGAGDPELPSMTSDTPPIPQPKSISISQDDVLRSYVGPRFTQQQRITGMDDLIRHVRQQRIAKQNEDKQKATMSFGLKSRNFKPRPAFEKKQWNLHAKPDPEQD